MHQPTPWGFRSEIYIDIGSQGRPVLLDVATSEYLLWNPRFDGEESASDCICGLVDIENGYFGISFGVERLAMAVNELARVHEVDYLHEYYCGLAAMVGRQLEPGDYQAGETLRILHRVLTDREFHPEALVHMDANGAKRMSRKRRKKIAALKRRIPNDLRVEALRELLDLHAAGQPWHERMSETVNIVAREIEEFRSTRVSQ